VILYCDSVEKAVRIGVTSLQSVLDCPFCFWLSQRVGSAPGIFAGITVQMDSAIKAFMRPYVGRRDLPSWFPVSGEFIDISKSLYADGEGISLSGKLDALVRGDDGYWIVDYKTGKPPEKIPDYYQMQLDGYAYLLEQNHMTPIAGGCLIYFTPDRGDISHNRFPFKITPLKAKVDSSRVSPILARARRILEAESPPQRSEDCDMCMWLEQVGRILSE